MAEATAAPERRAPERRAPEDEIAALRLSLYALALLLEESGAIAPGAFLERIDRECARLAASGEHAGLVEALR